MPDDAQLDAVASACGFLANLFLRADAGVSVTANLTAGRPTRGPWTTTPTPRAASPCSSPP